MKKLLVIVLAILIAASPVSIAEAPDDSNIYNTGEISFSVVNTYLHKAPINDFIILEFHWTNQTNDPTSFSMKLLVTGYQNGKELTRFKYEPDYDTDMIAVNSMTNIMPGYDNTDYEFIPLKDDSEVTIIIDKAFEVDNSFDEITYKVMPNNLPEFHWPEEE